MKDLIRKEIASLKPYEAYVIEKNIKLDANENPFEWPGELREELFAARFSFNRYPDGQAIALRNAISKYNGVNADEVLTGNGSDELIQIILTTFGGFGRSLLIHPPTFSMYATAAAITGTGVVEVPLLDGTNLDVEKILQRCSADDQIKVIILCNPNNPTGTLFPREEMLEIVKNTQALVVVDEAYTDFSGETLKDALLDYPNLLIMRTFSKAFAMAALRIGYVLGNKETIACLNKVRQPFNMNSFSQQAGILALKYAASFAAQVEIIKKETQFVYNEMGKISGLHVLPTRANFILFRPDDSNRWANELSRRGFSVRNLGELPVLGKSLRMSVGTPEENKAFLQVLRETADKF